jgi:benzoyl-CoA reductase/2-hydroxyglutaryl-CoA dehydratase subunit BcrC/BadD/HgdB
MKENRMKNQENTVIGCFPLYPPVELFSAMGLVPAVLWNLKDETPNLELSDMHVQSYACGIARELTQFVLSERGKTLGGIFSYNACDTLRNLPEILEERLGNDGRSVPMFRMHVPQVNPGHTDSSGYLKEEILRLVEDVEWAYGNAFSPEAFLKTAEDYTKMRTLCMEAETLVSRGALPFSAFCGAMLSGGALPVQGRIEKLLETMSRAQTGAAPGRSKVLVSGIMPPPAPVVRAIENAGMTVAANDIACLRRTYGYSPAVTDDPVGYYADYFSNKFPCTTLLYQSGRRLRAFMDLVESSGAHGVIFSGEKFCEHEYFEFPFLEDRLKEKGIPVLRLEFSVDDVQNTGAYTTRIEAFAEMLT